MKTVERPEFFFRYVVIDPGVRNKTAILFLYADFMLDALVAEREALLQGEEANTANIADTIHAIERELWPPGDDGGHPVQRFSDVELRLIMDLRRDHGLQVQPVKKKDPDGDTRAWRAMLQGGRFLVSDQCPKLIDQMRNAILNTRGTDLALEADGGHYDLVAAGRYAVKVANLRSNPFPAGWKMPTRGPDIVRARVRTADMPSLLPKTGLAKQLGATKPWWKR